MRVERKKNEKEGRMKNEKEGGKEKE